MATAHRLLTSHSHVCSQSRDGRLRGKEKPPSYCTVTGGRDLKLKLTDLSSRVLKEWLERSVLSQSGIVNCFFFPFHRAATCRALKLLARWILPCCSPAVPSLVWSFTSPGSFGKDCALMEPRKSIDANSKRQKGAPLSSPYGVYTKVGRHVPPA
jgi:hypothetical protein